MSAKVFFILIFCVVTTLQYTPFTACKSGSTPFELRLEGCTKSPCILASGKDVEAECDFAVVADTKDLKPVVLIQLFDESINYPLPEPDACTSLIDNDCPLDEGESVTYTLKMPIPDLSMQLTLHFQFSLMDSKNNTHVCFEFDAKIDN
ncbi:hypothetical protein PV325_002517 [Microctonus aethiopoides]|uniref:MD-2-related lipid-recognition domain-containing protein n=1 Tax=Microctonus aethiopoides TaxID=144406 RepID=A0AA39KKE8_9HYME|nr:hypothetical protein PV325_002517 [Microctonus aethiopoides]KAK0164768.1 hypothetical protein PV328_003345 [Microctonus aethiopoides]